MRLQVCVPHSAEGGIADEPLTRCSACRRCHRTDAKYLRLVVLYHLLFPCTVSFLAGRRTRCYTPRCCPSQLGKVHVCRIVRLGGREVLLAGRGSEVVLWARKRSDGGQRGSQGGTAGALLAPPELGESWELLAVLQVGGEANSGNFTKRLYDVGTGRAMIHLLAWKALWSGAARWCCIWEDDVAQMWLRSTTPSSGALILIAVPMAGCCSCIGPLRGCERRGAGGGGGGRIRGGPNRGGRRSGCPHR